MRTSQCFPEPYKHSSGNVKFELDLSNYATKADLKEASGIHTSTMASKTDLAGLKTKVDNINVDKLKTFPTCLSKLINVVDIEYVNIAKFLRTPLLKNIWKAL